ncbi:MAPEG family protein [Pseudoalteromonas sp. SWXJZ94C]|uniref:MAPEG family protein n=1 Tax=unclassified Pseudoalteromonas TaxID=194690 RepID=UPI001408C2B8|nr:MULTISPECIES: MAPEG family protein [unclassified Pseudoalteromonas]MBH0058769.1 MAPEG family protein [Pseudoalteromonas sp. SWXJZ94C]
MTEVALSAYLAFYFYLIMLVIQWAVATFSKAKEPNAVPGKIDENLSHDSFIFRAHRTFHNTLENSALFIGTVLFAFVINYQSPIFAICVWIYVIARLIHMTLYYMIATEKNPSPRSYFFLIGVIANVVMLVMIGLRLIA